MKKNFTRYPLCVFLLAFAFSASAQNTALNLTGGSNYVNFVQDIIPTGDDFTVEFWAYVKTTDVTAGLHQFISQGDDYGNGNTDVFSIGFDHSSGDKIMVGDNWNTGVTMPMDQWVHIAFTDAVDGSGDFTLFINGIQKATLPGGYFLPSSLTPTRIGVQTNTPLAQSLVGEVEELRIWNAVKTGADLRSTLFYVDPSSAGLFAYYPMNDDQSGVNVVNQSTSPDKAAGTTDGTWINTKSWVNSPIQQKPNALNFAGGGDQVSIPNNSSYDFTAAGGTIEMWVFPTSLSSNNSTLINRGSGASRYSFHLSSSAISVWNGSSFLYFNYVPADIPLNAWSHLAFVYNGTNNTAVYVNGSAYGNLGSLGTGTSAGIEPLGAANGQPYTIANDGNPVEAFTGSIDEVHIWNSQLTPLQVQGNMSQTLTGSEPGLIGSWGFDQGIAGGDNTGLLLAVDKSPTANDGLLSLSLTTGTVSNFVASTAPIVPLPVNFTSFTATALGNQALLQWETAQEQNSRDYSIERSGDGVHYSSIGTVAAAGNSTQPSDYSFTDAAPLNGLNYYRLKESDLDNKYMYSVIRTLLFSSDDKKQLVWFQVGKTVEVDLKQGSNEVYSVTDIGGRTIQQGQLSSGKLYLSQLAAGIYVVKVTTAAGKQLNTKVLVN